MYIEIVLLLVSLCVDSSDSCVDFMRILLCRVR